MLECEYAGIRIDEEYAQILRACIHKEACTSTEASRVRVELHDVDALRPLWRLIETEFAQKFPRYTRRIFDGLPGHVAIVVARPSDEDQEWHRDQNRCDSFNLCIPLTRITAENGATEVRRSDGQTIVMQCEPFECYVFNQRLLHRGLANRTCEDRPLVMVTLSRNPQRICFTNEVIEPDGGRHVGRRGRPAHTKKK